MALRDSALNVLMVVNGLNRKHREGINPPRLQVRYLISSSAIVIDNAESKKPVKVLGRPDAGYRMFNLSAAHTDNNSQDQHRQPQKRVCLFCVVLCSSVAGWTVFVRGCQAIAVSARSKMSNPCRSSSSVMMSGGLAKK